jgi:hypothetical protein
MWFQVLQASTAKSMRRSVSASWIPWRIGPAAAFQTAILHRVAGGADYMP